jgi:hypothetical protein
MSISQLLGAVSPAVGRGSSVIEAHSRRVDGRSQMKDTGDVGSGATSDIIHRLRVDACNMGSCYANQTVTGLFLMRWQDTASDAANEIERLREKLKEANAASRRFLKELGRMP